MKQLKLLIAAALVLSPFMASADPISLEETGTLGSTGGSFNIIFADLVAPAVGTGGTLTIASQAGSTFDLYDHELEYFDLELDGVSAGRYACSDNTGGTNMGCTGGNLAEFTWVIYLENFASLISDGTLDLFFDFGQKANINLMMRPNNNTVVATLDYTVPEPGTLALLGLGLTGMGLMRRKKKV